jgi:hypothetical protein
MKRVVDGTEEKEGFYPLKEERGEEMVVLC